MCTRKSTYEVSARELNSRSTWDVQVVASTEHEAKNIGVNALVEMGLINKDLIKHTAVHKTGGDVWVGV